MQLLFLYEKSGPIVLVLPGLMAGWLAGRRNSSYYILKIFQIKTHGSESCGQEKRPRDDYRESIYAYQNVLKNRKQN